MEFDRGWLEVFKKKYFISHVVQTNLFFCIIYSIHTLIINKYQNTNRENYHNKVLAKRNYLKQKEHPRILMVA